MKRASYREGIRWIAKNDEPEDTDPARVAGMISVALLGDLFGKAPEQVARDVVAARLHAGDRR